MPTEVPVPRKVKVRAVMGLLGDGARPRGDGSKSGEVEASEALARWRGRGTMNRWKRQRATTGVEPGVGGIPPARRKGQEAAISRPPQRRHSFPEPGGVRGGQGNECSEPQVRQC